VRKRTCRRNYSPVGIHPKKLKRDYLQKAIHRSITSKCIKSRLPKGKACRGIHRRKNKKVLILGASRYDDGSGTSQTVTKTYRKIWDDVRASKTDSYDLQGRNGGKARETSDFSQCLNSSPKSGPSDHHPFLQEESRETERKVFLEFEKEAVLAAGGTRFEGGSLKGQVGGGRSPSPARLIHRRTVRKGKRGRILDGHYLGSVSYSIHV